MKNRILLVVAALVALLACTSAQSERFGVAQQGLDFVCPDGCTCTCEGGSGGSAGASGASGAGSSGDAGAAGMSGGGASGGSGGVSGSAGSAGASGAAGAGGSGPTPTCNLAAYTPGVWRPTVAQPPLGAVGDGAAFGLTIDPNNPGTVWVGIYDGPAPGLYKTTDCGATWAEVGNFAGVIQVRINPANSQELYVGVGVGTASSNGFYYSSNGGATWSDRSTWTNSVANYYDVYSIAVDPTDFAHALVAFHSPGTNGLNASGIVETTNKGSTWTQRGPTAAWSGETQGCTIAFLYDPATSQGNAQTWLFGTQSKGFWRTTNGGTSWTQATTRTQSHGGNAIYYAPTGALFSGSAYAPMRSTDNGATWTGLSTASYGYYMAVGGDGTNLFTGKWQAGSGTSAMNLDTLADNGNSWSATGPNTYGAFEFSKSDPVNRIMYAGMWESGVWAMKLP